MLHAAQLGFGPKSRPLLRQVRIEIGMSQTPVICEHVEVIKMGTAKGGLATQSCSMGMKTVPAAPL